jgi:hypothetical protein
VVRAAKGHDERLARVEASAAHGGHHGLGTTHVERDLVEARDLLDHLDVLERDLVERAQVEALVLRRRPASGDELLVLLVAAHIDAVRAGDVE